MVFARVCLGKVVEVYSVPDPLGSFDGIVYETEDTMTLLDSYFQQVVLIGLGTCPEFCDDMLQLKRYAADLREVGREVDRNILIFGLDFSALDPMVGVAKICRERQVRRRVQ